MEGWDDLVDEVPAVQASGPELRSPVPSSHGLPDMVAHAYNPRSEDREERQIVAE